MRPRLDARHDLQAGLLGAARRDGGAPARIGLAATLAYVGGHPLLGDRRRYTLRSVEAWSALAGLQHPCPSFRAPRGQLVHLVKHIHKEVLGILGELPVNLRLAG